MQSGHRRIGIVVVVSLVAVAALAVAAPSQAKKHKYASDVTINLDPTASRGFSVALFGTVKSKKDQCVEDREVDILFQGAGPTSFRGHTTTDANGNWRLEGVHANVGQLFAVVDKFSYKKKRVCKHGQAGLEFPP